MGKQTIPFAFLVEHCTEDGERRLSGRFGSAKIIGRIIGTTEDGQPRWALAVTEDDRAKERRNQYARRKRGDA